MNSEALVSLPTDRHCQALSPRTFGRCRNRVAPHSSFCRLHPPGAPRTTARLVGPPRSRRLRGGSYLKHLSATGQEVFEETLGDLSPLAELAMVRGVLAEILERRRETQDLERFLLSVPSGGHLGQDEAGNFSPAPSTEELAAERIRKNRKANADDQDVIAAAERVVKVALAAGDMLAGRRVQISFENQAVESEVRRQVERFTREFFTWVPELLCPECSQRLGEELQRNRRTEVVGEN